MKKARMNISHFCFILFILKIFGDMVSTILQCYYRANDFIMFLGDLKGMLIGNWGY